MFIAWPTVSLTLSIIFLMSCKWSHIDAEIDLIASYSSYDRVLRVWTVVASILGDNRDIVLGMVAPSLRLVRTRKDSTTKVAGIQTADWHQLAPLRYMYFRGIVMNCVIRYSIRLCLTTCTANVPMVFRTYPNMIHVYYQRLVPAVV